jgi:RNA polymerase sigma-70 factor (TIGR02960 family)
VTEATLTRARAGDEHAFRALTDPYRRELHVHCYRIVGSVQDAEDLVQETLLAAWRGLEGFEGRASLRSWLYRIATNRCLNALRDGSRRPPVLPISSSGFPTPTRVGEPLWLEPYPDALLEDAGPGPEASYEAKETIALAYVAALQQLPPRQRATLVLREVLGFSAAEVAQTLGTSVASVNSALQRARATLDAQLPIDRERAPLPRSPGEQQLVGRFADAFEAGDIDSVVSLLTDDALVRMPPEPGEYQGPLAVAEFLRSRDAIRAGEIRLVATRANGQPAFGYYVVDAHAPVARAYGLLVLTLEGDRIAAITRFGNTGLFSRFGLPRTLPL